MAAHNTQLDADNRSKMASPFSPSPSSSSLFKPDLCHQPSPFYLSLAIILPIGALVSYLPQHIKISKRKSHIGLNLFCYVGLTLTNCCSMVAFLLLHWQETTQCCGSTSTISQCLYNTLRPLQFVVTFVCAAFIVVLYVVHFREKEEIAMHPKGGGETSRTIQRKIFLLIVVCLLVTISGVGVEYYHSSQGPRQDHALVVSYTSGLSVAAAIITSIHWMPQVYETWRLQSLGSLSMALLVLQSFGCILTFVSVSKGGIMIGVPYLVASFMQFVLMGLSFMFWCRDQKNLRSRSVPSDENNLLQSFTGEENERLTSA